MQWWLWSQFGSGAPSDQAGYRSYAFFAYGGFGAGVGGTPGGETLMLNWSNVIIAW